MRAKATDFTEASSDSVGVGTIVDLKDSNTGDKMKYTILGPGTVIQRITFFPTSLRLHKILGKKAGENVEIDIEGNEQSLLIEGVSRWVGQK